MAFVIYSKELGIYLGGWPGLASWTKLPGNMPRSDYAITFESIYDAMASAVCRSQRPNDVQYIPVEPDEVLQGRRYASVAACVAAGLPAWNPNEGERASA